ncbi:MAG: B12-binding domain-containing radical SAM protein [Ferrovibrio sp.]|uniref:B12-binding domain-containing radical SAM protein n=1 Tax=Ferrovibrio sp. TaxID=1917215 RepID=UPI00391D1B82
MSALTEKRVWLADLTYTQQTIAADVIPNAIGGIATYTERWTQFTTPIRLFKYPEKLVQALAREGPPNIIGFSNYVWNGDLSLKFASAIKHASPNTIVIFGGPNYPTTAEEQAAWLRQNRDVDFYIIKEGEAAFSKLTQALIDAVFDIEKVKALRLPSVHCITETDEAILSDPIVRLTDLTEIPSPYTSGRLDEFFDGRLLPIIQTNRGCPFGCTFCVEGVDYYNKVRRNAADKVSAELHYIGKKMQELRAIGGRNDLFIADSNFAMYKDDIETAKTLAATRKQYGWPEYINVATGKNQKERVLEASRIIDGALRLSGSVQSLDANVLENIKRKNIDAQALFDLGLQAESVGANTYSEVILCLPGDSLAAHLSTVRTVMNAGFTNIYLFQLMLLPGTEMATPESKQQYGMLTRYRVLPRCYGHFDVFGKQIIAAEIEEICVANSTLPFEDYLAARRFHLVVTIYYNDGIFAALLKLLRELDVPVYDWMEELNNAEMSPRLAALFSAFEQATKDELWDNRADLEAFIQQAGVVEKFISGELGNNLLFVHKTLGITEYLPDLADFARQTIRSCLEAHNKASDDTFEFIDDALEYHCKRANNLFRDLDAQPVAKLNYNINAYLAAGRNVEISQFRLKAPMDFNFILDDEQKAIIERYLGIYGDSPVSIGRILSKVHVKKLFRHAVPAKQPEKQIMPIKVNPQAFMLSGLQE